jgi:hypothetical protein
VRERSRLLQTLTKERWSDPQCISRLRSEQLENLAEHERQPVRPIQALEHAERAANLHFLDQQRPLGIRGAFRR